MNDGVRTKGSANRIEMSENHMNDECGCLMIQFAKDNNIACTSAGVINWRKRRKIVAKLDDGVYYNTWEYPKNFGEVQKRINGGQHFFED